MPTIYYRKKGPDIVTESMDGEVVIIDIDTGAYYSLEEAGAYAWNNLIAGASKDAVVNVLKSKFPEANVDEQISTLIASLGDAGLLCEAEAPAAEAPLSEDLPASCEKFNLECYTDMKDLLMLDPIHEVEEAGWPHRREDSVS
ncbi:PqqD family protein [Cerasicoccus frondis]|uniref:PqqD family protein n=1 Tax=Cerasicoccus frondis TaxID=490090 RepID=UPI00285276C8|nr:PqqD family protein [Cerasicoccus frondis]